MRYEVVFSGTPTALPLGGDAVAQSIRVGWQGLGVARITEMGFHLVTDVLAEFTNDTSSIVDAALGVRAEAVFGPGTYSPEFEPQGLVADWATLAPVNAMSARPFYAGGHNHSTTTIALAPAAPDRFLVDVSLTGDIWATQAGQTVQPLITWQMTTPQIYAGFYVTAQRMSDQADTVQGTQFHDLVSLGRGDDVFYGRGGDDLAEGGQGDDLLVGGAGDDTLHGNMGNDTLTGGDGRDWLEGGQGDDLIFAGAGRDTVRGGTGNDTIRSGDGGGTIDGGLGDDHLFSGAGVDYLYGRTGRDVFHFANVRHSDAANGLDWIFDFTQGRDRIDMSALDADFTTSGNQALVFAGTTATAHAIWFENTGSLTNLRVDVNGDGFWDMQVHVAGDIRFQVEDFIL